MSRPLRIDYPNAWHHVMNRARRGTALFIDKTDFQQFIDLLQETAGLVKRLDQYVWSSHKGYLSKAKKWSWLYKDFVLQMLTDQMSSQIRIYKQNR